MRVGGTLRAPYVGRVGLVDSEYVLTVPAVE